MPNDELYITQFLDAKHHNREVFMCENCQTWATRKIGSTQTLCKKCRPKQTEEERKKADRERYYKNIEKNREYQKEYRHLGKNQKFCEMCGRKFWAFRTDAKYCFNCCLRLNITPENNLTDEELYAIRCAKAKSKNREVYRCEKCQKWATRKIGNTQTVCKNCRPYTLDRKRQDSREYYKKNKDKKLAQQKEYRRRKKILQKKTNRL